MFAISNMCLNFGSKIFHCVGTWHTKIQVSSSLLSPVISERPYEGKCQLSDGSINGNPLYSMYVPINGNFCYF